MLVLTRCRGESIVIDIPGGSPITVRVCRIAGGQVQIGIDAAPEFKIYRPKDEKLPPIDGTRTERGVTGAGHDPPPTNPGDSPQTGDHNEDSEN